MRNHYLIFMVHTELLKIKYLSATFGAIALISFISIIFQYYITEETKKHVNSAHNNQDSKFHHNFLPISKEPPHVEKINFVILPLYFKDIRYTISVMEKESIDISAEVILKTKNGKSMINEDIPITSENIEQFQPSPDTIENATSILEKLNFTVFNNNYTLTIQGKAELFEKVFNAKITVEKNTFTGKTTIKPDRELNIPDTLDNIVEGVVFTPPPDFHL